MPNNKSKKFYYINSTGRAFIAFGETKINYVELSYNDTLMFFESLADSKIKKAYQNGETLRATYSDNYEVVFDLASFSNKYNIYYEYFNKVQSDLKEYLENERLKKKNKKNGKHLVNRSLSSKKGPFVVTAASLTVASALALNFMMPNIMPWNKNKSKDDNKKIPTEDVSETKYIGKNNDDLVPHSDLHLSPTPNSIPKADVTDTYETPSEVALEDELVITEDATSYSANPISTYSLNVPFKDQTETGKLDETKAYWGDTIKYYSTRFGIPYDVACAMISQEREEIKDGHCENICQLTGLVGENIKVSVYDEFGPTGEIEEFTVTSDMINDIDGNVKAGLAYTRFCIDKHRSFTTGLFTYNQGPYSIYLACKYYGLNEDDYYGEENSDAARDLIVKYYLDTYTAKTGDTWGDPNYISNVFSYLKLEDRASSSLEVFVNGEKHLIEINNTLEYNNSQARS